MKCPMRIGRRPYDGGEDCDMRCAWLVEAPRGCYVCALTAIACDRLRKLAAVPANTMEVER